MIDISIKSIDKYLTPKKIDEILNTNCLVEQKTDGVKISILKIDDTGDPLKDFIVSYKEKIIFSGEFDYSDGNSRSNSQFKFITDFIKKLSNYSSIPNSTEFFCEFAMNKSTLSSNYTSKGLLLLGYSSVRYKITNGHVYSSGEFKKATKEFSDILGIPLPVKIFEGKLKNYNDGRVDRRLRKLPEFELNTFENKMDFLSLIKSEFLEIPSQFGGKEEGVVLWFENGLVLKMQQDYQLDQSKRAEIKDKYRMSPEEESKYWESIESIAKDLVKKIKSKNLEDQLKELGNLLRGVEAPEHSKKSRNDVIDDIQIKVRSLLKDRGTCFLFLGKMRILTNAHYKIINDAQRKYDNGVVCLVNNKDTRKFADLRMKMVEMCFPELAVFEANSGYLANIVYRSPYKITHILCGSDRFEDYKDQVKNQKLDIEVVETPRTDDDISASKVIENLDDFDYFKKNTPKQIHSLYQEIKKVFE